MLELKRRYYLVYPLLVLLVFVSVSCTMKWIKPQKKVSQIAQNPEYQDKIRGTLELNSNFSEQQKARRMSSAKRGSVSIIHEQVSPYADCYHATLENMNQKKPAQAWVAVLYSRGGSGHISAAESVRIALQDAQFGFPYHVASIDILPGMLNSGQDLFDAYMKEESWTKVWLLAKAKPLAEWKMKIFDTAVVEDRIFNSCRSREFLGPPAAIISVIPVGNGLYWKNAMDHVPKIPFVIVPTDFDPEGFIAKVLDAIQTDVEHYRNWTWISLPWYTSDPIPNPLDTQQDLLSTSEIVEDLLYSVPGYPLRKPMVIQKTRLERKQLLSFMLKKQQQLVSDIGVSDLVLGMSFGGKGGAWNTINDYIAILKQDAVVKRILSATNYKRLVVIVADGGNHQIQENILKIAKNTGSLTLLSTGHLDAEKMANFMGGVDLLIGKPGGGSVAEVLALKTPMLIRTGSTTALPWELYNLAVIVKEGWGLSMQENNELPEKIIQGVALKGKEAAVYSNFYREKGFRHDFELFLARLGRSVY